MFHPSDPLNLDGASMPVLAEYLGSTHPQNRADAACAIGDRLRCKDIAHVEADVENLLLKLLQDPIAEVRFEAAITLAQIQHTQAFDTLAKALKNRHTRLDAIRALGVLQHPQATEVLLPILHAWWMPWADKLQAAAALCALKHPEGIHYLTLKLQSPKHAERAATIHFIGESAHPQALDILTTLAQNPTEPLRDSAVRALGLLRNPAALTVLNTVLQQAKDELAEDAIESIHIINKNK